MIKGIIFDTIGPLLRKREDYLPDAVVQFAEKLADSIKNDDELISRLKKDIITSDYTIDEIATRIVDKYEKIPGVWDNLLPKLKINYQLAVINNGMGITIPRFKEKNNFAEFFPIFINSAKVEISKPAAKIYQLALEEIGLTAADCVFIDDDQKNVAGAERLGLKGIVYKNYNDLIAGLKKLNIKI